MDELGTLAALGKRQRAQSLLDKARLQLRGLGERGRAKAKLGIEELRVPKHDGAGRVRSPIVANHRHGSARESKAELARIRDRGGREQKLGCRTVKRSESAEAANDVRHVRPKHAAIHVRLIDDHKPEVREHVRPQIVVRQHPNVEHVGIREQYARRPPQRGALLNRRVSVIDRRPQGRQPIACQRAELILRESLGRVEIDRAGVRIGGQGIKHRQVERECFARRCARRDQHVLAPLRRIPGVPLVGVERIDTDRVDYRGGERLGQRRKRPFLLWLSTSMGKFDAQEKVCCKQEAVVSHPAIVRLLPANGSVCSLIRLEVGREALAEVLARLRPNHGFA